MCIQAGLRSTADYSLHALLRPKEKRSLKLCRCRNAWSLASLRTLRCSRLDGHVAGSSSGAAAGCTGLGRSFSSSAPCSAKGKWGSGFTGGGREASMATRRAGPRAALGWKTEGSGACRGSKPWSLASKTAADAMRSEPKAAEPWPARPRSTSRSSRRSSRSSGGRLRAGRRPDRPSKRLQNLHQTLEKSMKFHEIPQFCKDFQ